jgi:hypothetical protein
VTDKDLVSAAGSRVQNLLMWKALLCYWYCYGRLFKKAQAAE